VAIFKKEKEVINDTIEHLNAVEAGMKTALRAVETYLEGDIAESKALARKVDDIESRADLICLRIWDKLYSGAYLPLEREAIYKLIESVDRVANAAEACCDFFLAQRPQIPQELKSEILRISQEAFSVIVPLRNGVLSYIEGEIDVNAIREEAKQVGIKESTVDKIEWDLTRQIFTSSLDYGHKVHLRLCLDTIVEIADRAEDAADQLELNTMKSRV
jgi:predicted phosphate transport protein (TIGR00153 family)